MTLEQLLAGVRAQISAKLAIRNGLSDQLQQLRAAETTDEIQVADLRARKETLDTELNALEVRANDLHAEIEADARAAKLAAIIVGETRQPHHDEVARIGAEARTYRRDEDPKGLNFAADVMNAWLGDHSAGARLSRHRDEETRERGRDWSIRGGGSGQHGQRAVGTGAFSGIVVPQYLVDDFALLPRADQPLADAMRQRQLPAEGMQVFIGRLTTGTSSAEQTAENGLVSETDADDTLIPINVLTAAGAQTVSRQASERGMGVEDTLWEDLISAQRTNLDSLIINRAVTGLTNVATPITYTDAAPTGAKLYPRLLQAPSQVASALLKRNPGDTIAVMHSRRWYWMQSQTTTSWPMFQPPNVAPQMGGNVLATRYGSGFAGFLPAGVPLILDNNISVTLGAGAEDEIFFISQLESHLWRDPNAPLMVRADQPSAKRLGVDLVVYSYFAYTFSRLPHAQTIRGTGLTTPTFA